MELKSIEELLKFRRKLVKNLNQPMPHLTEDPVLAATDAEIWRWGTERQKRLLEEIDAEIRERTGGLVDPESGAKNP